MQTEPSNPSGKHAALKTCINLLILLLLTGLLVTVSFMVGRRYATTDSLSEQLEAAQRKISCLQLEIAQKDTSCTGEMKALQDAIETLEVRRDLTNGIDQLNHLLNTMMQILNGRVYEFGTPWKDSPFGFTEWPGGDEQVDLILRIHAYRKSHPVRYKTGLDAVDQDDYFAYCARRYKKERQAQWARPEATETNHTNSK